MVFLQIFKFLVIYCFIKLFVLCECINYEEETSNSLNENIDDENVVLESVYDSVYDTMRHNYETNLRQNMDRMNLLSDMRNKRNVNEPMSMTPMNINSAEYFKNHQYEVNRKSPVNFPLGFKSPQRLMPDINPLQHRSDYEYEEYTHKCPEKPTVQTFHIADDHQEKHHFPDLSTVLLVGLKYLLGGLAIFALPFLVLKALFLPLKFFLILKGLAVLKTFFALSLLLRFLRFNRRVGNGNPFYVVPGKHKDKLHAIKDILNSDEVSEELDYKSDDDDVISKESVSGPMYLNNPFNSSEVSEEFVQNLAKLIKLKNKKW